MPQRVQQNAFTLIELLIVIAIVGLLAGIVVAIVNPDQYLKQGRDSQRIAKIFALQTAISNAVTRGQIELVDTSSCTDCNSIDGGSAVDGSGWVRFDNLGGTGIKDYIPILPKDPKNDGSLMFSYYSDGNMHEDRSVGVLSKYIEKN